MNLSVIIPTHSGDRDQAVRLIEWIQSLGPQKGEFFVLAAKHLQDPAILPVGWHWLTDWLDYKSDWKSTTDATGPNMMWQQAAREMCQRKAGPWLWLEPDAVPIRSDWLSALADEYQRGGKPFMGGYAPSSTARMSGVAVYHQDTSRLAMRAMMTRELAFDMAGAEEFERMGIHFTDLIADQFRCDPFKDQADFEARVPSHAAIHHGDKTGGVYRFAGARLGKSAPTQIVRVPPAQDAMTEALNDKMAEVTKSLVEECRTAPCPETEFPIKIRAGEEIKQPEGFLDGMRTRLNWIMSRASIDKKRRAAVYAELQKHGVECGRKKRVLKKRVVAAH